MLGEELSFFLEGHTGLSRILSEADLNELTVQVNEPLDKDTMSLTEFNNIVDQWSMKL